MKLLIKIKELIMVSPLSVAVMVLGLIALTSSSIDIYHTLKNKMGVDYPLLYCLQSKATTNPYDKELVYYISEETTINKVTYLKYSFRRNWEPSHGRSFYLSNYTKIGCVQADLITEKEQ